MTDNQLEHVANVVMAYVSNNPVPRAELATLMADVSKAFSALSAPVVEAEPAPTPAVNPKRSVFPDYIVSLENGKQFRSMKRHLSGLGMTPAEYREKWKLPHDYPMVAASYAAQRSSLAKKLGLGRKPAAQAAPAAAPSKSPEAAAASVEPARKPRKARSKTTSE